MQWRGQRIEHSRDDTRHRIHDEQKAATFYLFAENQTAVLVRRNGQQFHLHRPNWINGETNLIFLRQRFKVVKLLPKYNFILKFHSNLIFFSFNGQGAQVGQIDQYRESSGRKVINRLEPNDENWLKVRDDCGSNKRNAVWTYSAGGQVTPTFFPTFQTKQRGVFSHLHKWQVHSRKFEATDPMAISLHTDNDPKVHNVTKAKHWLLRMTSLFNLLPVSGKSFSDGKDLPNRPLTTEDNL